MAKIQAVWALDIGQAALKALKLVPGDSPETVEAAAFDYVEHPKILSQPDADPESLVREALATFMDRNDLKGCKVAISVPGQAGLVKFIKLPPVEKKRIPDIVKFEAKQQIPFALEEVIWAYQQIGDDEEGGDEDFTMAEVGLFAMKRDQINRAILPFRAAGIEVDIVQMGPIALYNFIAADVLKGSDLKGSVVLIDIGADHTDLIITDGTRIWQRNVPIGGNHFTRALTKELKLTFAKAEHLKRNATKAPDPKAIFTAMRGVFNDFASEVNRSIGFYTSVNRSSKITKVVGLGNGFKLPGLQKFLQQNLNGLEVERLDKFARLVGEEVTSQPQFAENLPSFGVSYGLALQGLGRCPLRTNLLPPEIEQVRMVRAKKPWILAASALLMLGFSALFYSDYKALAKVSSAEFKSAVDKANGASKRGGQYKSDFDAAKGDYDSKLVEGNALIINDADRAKWPGFLKLINAYLPDPINKYKDAFHPGPLDPKNSGDIPIIEKTVVHIDRISPVYVADVATGWFDQIPEQFKNLMHPYDRNTPPTAGEGGWIIQIVGHHYNPTPTAAELREPLPKRTAFGPRNYLQEVVLPGLYAPSLRQKGVHHVALAWMTIDKNWTQAQGAGGTGISSLASLLPRGSAPASAGGGGGDLGSMASMMMASAGGMKSRGMGMEGGGGMAAAGGGGMMAAMGNRGGGMGMMGMEGMGPGGGGMNPNDPASKMLTKRTRTDFLIQFIWQPPAGPSADPKAEYDDILKKLREAEADPKAKGAVPVPDEQLDAASRKTAQDRADQIEKAIQQVQAKVQADQQAKGAGTPPATGTAPPVVDPGAPTAAPKK